MPSFIRVDIFPATVIVNGTVSYAPSRAVVTDDSVYVYQDSPNGPAEVFTARLDDFSGRNTVGYQAVTSDGDQVQISRAGGCGCGSRLRGFIPFPGVALVHNP